MAGKNSLLVLALVTLLSLLPGTAVANIEILPKTGVPTLARWVAAPSVHKRTGPNPCNADNVLRALRRFSTNAVPFCSSFIHIPKSTVTTTVTTTTMPGYTVSQTTSVATTTTSTITVFETTTTMTTQRVTPIFTAPSQPTKRSERDSDEAKKGKDDEKNGKDEGEKDRDDKALPSYVSEYPTARISSACSCLSIPPSTTTTTSTSTVTSPTPATTVVQTNTNTITATTTTTSTITSTSTISTTICPAPTKMPGAVGIGLGNVGGNFVGTIQFPNAQSPEDCCLSCFDPSRSNNCAAFAAGPGFCFLIVNSAGPSPNARCPAGLGPGNIFIDPSQSATNFGGPGPCAGPEVIFTR